MSTTLKKNGQKQLITCGCGCKTPSHWHRLHLLRGIDGKNYHVLDECREQFEEELKAYVISKDLMGKLRYFPFWRRWAYAKSWWSCQYILRARLQGVDAAAKFARRDTMLFVLPKCIAAVYSKLSGKKHD